MEKVDKLELIYDSTVNLIKRDGINRVSVSKIAQEAGIGKGSIYYYVKTKDEIIDGIAKKTIKRIVHEYNLIVSTNELDVFQKMELLFNCTYATTFSDGSENNMRVLFNQPDLYLHQRLNASSMVYLVPILEKIITEGIDKNIFKSDNPRKGAELIIMDILMLFDSQLLPREELIDTVERMDYLSSIIENSLSAPSGSLHLTKKIINDNIIKGDD